MVPLDLLGDSTAAHRYPLYLKCRHSVSKRQKSGDHDYSKSDKLDQIIWPFSVGISISKETRGANADRCGRFHVCYTPFVAAVCVDC